MQIEEFRRIITSFADNPADIVVERGRLLVQIRDEVLEADLFSRDGSLYVREDEEEQTASGWLIRRVARLQQLADRIINHVIEEEHFVPPAGEFQDQIEYNPQQERTPVPDAVSFMPGILGRRPAGTTSITYLTSDAGEGKTTLINEVARRQAAAYKQRRTDWLLVPVYLGGRGFSRFDDVVVATLVNQFRFQLFYYEAFIELVRLGVVVPAFDGFEEVFVETSSGEALSALGNLVHTLNSAGTVVIAARKAYYDYRSLSLRARLLESISRDSVAFSQLSLKRWSKDQFVTYGHRRGLDEAQTVYDLVAQRLGEGHPVITRAVLVRRLLDVALQEELNTLLSRLGDAPQDYFYQFVNTIVEREANSKWIDRSGEPHKPLLSVAQHHEILGMIAHEMWLMNTEVLRTDLLEVLTDVFAETHQLSPVILRQIRERLPHHSLLATTGARQPTVGFDHEDFRYFFLGEALAHSMILCAELDLRSALQVNLLPPSTCDAAVQRVRREEGSVAEIIEILMLISSADVPTSFTRENCGALIVRLLDRLEQAITVKDVVFPADSFVGRELHSVEFLQCYFQPTSLAGTVFQDCVFTQCRFERLEVSEDTTVEDTRILESEVTAVYHLQKDRRAYDPLGVREQLVWAGFELSAGDLQVEEDPRPIVMDELTSITTKVLRMFLRGTQINELPMRQNLGVRANLFFDHALPDLLRVNVFERVPYHGAGNQMRLRVGRPLDEIDKAIEESEGNFERLIQLLEVRGS